jgi:hypothetical protein
MTKEYEVTIPKEVLAEAAEDQDFKFKLKLEIEAGN